MAPRAGAQGVALRVDGIASQAQPVCSALTIHNFFNAVDVALKYRLTWSSIP